MTFFLLPFPPFRPPCKRAMCSSAVRFYRLLVTASALHCDHEYENDYDRDTDPVVHIRIFFLRLFPPLLSFPFLSSPLPSSLPQRHRPFIGCTSLTAASTSEIIWRALRSKSRALLNMPMWRKESFGLMLELLMGLGSDILSTAMAHRSSCSCRSNCCIWARVTMK
jgi:hypothetical protein